MKINNIEEIEKRLSEASKQMISEDMFSRITQSIAHEERTMNMNTTTTTPAAGKKRIKRWIGLAAAACMLLICCIFGRNYYVNNIAVDSIVDIDVNPGIEISANKNDVVLDVVAVNKDAEKILDGMNLKNTELKVAVNAIIGSMVQNGYLIDGENSILVSVQNDDLKRATYIRNLVLSDIDASLKDNNITASIVNQTVSDSSDAKNLADEQGITFGKATFILNLCAKDTSLDPNALAKMNIREIAGLITEKNIDIRDIVDYDADDSIWENIEDAVEDTDEDHNVVPTTPVISAEQAKEIALKHAGISAESVTFSEIHLENDDGVQVYEFDFNAGSIEYDYEINAATGDVISSSKEVYETLKPSSSTPAASAQPQASLISATKAKEIALNHAGVSAASAAFIKVELDTDGGMQIYEIEFCVGSTEYDYDINALTGNVIKYESEVDD